jgi:hypothetical protein
MLRILGSAKKLCDGWTRRDLLRAGGVGLLGLPALRSADAATAPKPAGRAKSVILLYLYGAPSQLETFDLKPEAPTDVRSQFNPIATSLPGVQICEHLPRTAKLMNQAALIRSMSHPYNIHSAAYALTGVPKSDIPLELNPHDSRHWPFLGSVMDYLQAGRGRRDIPLNVALPFKFSSRSPFKRGGPYGGFLGGGYDPVWAEYADATVKGDPYQQVSLGIRFRFGDPGMPEVVVDQLDKRRSLLQQLDRQQSVLDSSAGRSLGRQQAMAFNLLTSPQVNRALDLDREPQPLRERYGATLFGQAALTARRLVEHGVQVVTVFWDEFVEANSAWDTHNRQVTRLKDCLLPGFDQAYSALLTDLADRGRLDDTLVVVLSEHGRTPKLNKEPGGGREHWSWSYCTLMAGGGIKRGTCYGASDREAAFPKENPVSPKDVLCTIYHLLGVDPQHTHLKDREGRPLAVLPEGRVLKEILA